MSHRLDLAALPLLAALAGPAPVGPAGCAEAPARSAAADTLVGRVTAGGGESPLAGAELRLDLGDEVRESRTDSSGRYVFLDLPAGRFEMWVEAPGFRPLDLVVTLPSRGRFRVDVRLDPAERDERGEAT